MGKQKTPVTDVTDYRNFFTCKVCGKAFYTPLADDWAYQKRLYQRNKSDLRLWFCSWGCLRKWEAENEK